MTGDSSPSVSTTTPAPPESDAVPQTSAANRPALRFTARDLLNVAIFAVIYFVVVYAISMLGIISPLAMLLTLPLSIIVAGIPYLLFLTRVKHVGMVTLSGIVFSLFTLLTGHPWTTVVALILASLLAEVILGLGRYRSRWATIWAYAVFSLWFIGPLLPMLINRQEYLNTPGVQAMGPEYVAAFDQTVTVAAVWIYNGATLVSGLVGGLLGSVILRKHFTRAGLV